MTKKSKEMLVEDWVPPAGGVEEACVKVTVCKEHGNAPGEDWEGQEEKNGGYD